MNRNKAEVYKKKKLKDSELRSKTPPRTVEMDLDGGKSIELLLNEIMRYGVSLHEGAEDGNEECKGADGQ